MAHCPADGIDNEEGLCGSHDPANRLDIVSHAGAALGKRAEEGDRIGVLFQELCHGVRRKRFPPGDLMANHLDPKCFAKQPPSLGEFPRLQYDRLPPLGNDIDHGGFHRPGSGTGEHEHVVRGLEHILQPIQDLSKEGAKLLGPMVADRLSQCQQGPFRNLGRTGGHQAVLGHPGNPHATE